MSRRPWWRGGRRAEGPLDLDPVWWDVLGRNARTVAMLPTADRDHLGRLTARFLRDKHWEAARGFTLSDEVKVTIAAQACQLVLGLDPGRDWFGPVHTIVVHRSTHTQRGERAVGATAIRTDTPRRLVGRTGAGWPVVLSWDATLAEGRNPGGGRNVVHHEFAHQLDLLDGTLDGTPPVADSLRSRWVEVCTAEYQAVRRGGDGLLRSYAGESPAEFFAVATEAFLSRPVELRELHPDLYDVLRAFYRQEPAAAERGDDAQVEVQDPGIVSGAAHAAAEPADEAGDAHGGRSDQYDGGATQRWSSRG